MSAIRHPPSRLLAFGIMMGVIAGFCFTLFQMLVTLLYGGSETDYLRVVASIALGELAFASDLSVGLVVLIGLTVRLVLSGFFGSVFVLLLAVGRQLWSSTGLLAVYGTVYGFLLWVTNFLILAPIYFPSFTTVDQFWIGFFAHTFLYGTVVGLLVAILREQLLPFGVGR